MLYSVYSRITEALESSYEVFKVPRNSKMYMNYFFVIDQYTFTTESGDKYIILFQKDNPVYSNYLNNFYSDTLGSKFKMHNFDFLKVVENSNGSLEIIQTGDSTSNFMKVFATVIDTAMSFYTQRLTDVDMLCLTALNNEPRRNSLYPRLAKKFASTQGGEYLGFIPMNVTGYANSCHIVISSQIKEKLKNSYDDFREEFQII